MRRFALIFLAVIILLCVCACQKKEIVQTMSYEEASSYAGFRDTMLYYASDDGLLVPLMRQIPWEEGIGKAALGYLVDTPENRAVLQKYDLRAPLPEGTAIQLRIRDDKEAVVTLTSCTPPEDAAQEQLRLASIVNTLTAFPTIDTVSIRMNGADATPTRSISALALNAEDAAAQTSTGTLHAMTLFFPNTSASLNIPVTRYQSAKPTFEAAVQGLLDGPQSKSLAACFPADTALLSAKIEDGVATVDFSSAFTEIADTEGRLSAARDTLYLTACAFTDVHSLDILVEGKPFTADAATEDLPRYPNTLK